VVFSGSSSRLEVNSFLNNWSGWLGSCSVGSGVSGSVKHSKSRSSLGDSTVDVTTDVSGTGDSDLLSTSSSRWSFDPLDGNLSSGNSFSGHSTIGGLGDGIKSSKSGSTGSSFDSSVIISLGSKWIWLDNHVDDPLSLHLGSGVGSGVEHSRLGSVGSGVSSWFGWGWSSGWEISRWVTEVSTISISDSVIWNSHVFSEFTAHLKNDIIVSDIRDSLLEGKGQIDWFTSVIWSGNIDHLSAREEPTFNSLTVESSSVLTLGHRGEGTSGFLGSSGNSDGAPLGLFVGVFSTSNEFTESSSDIIGRGQWNGTKVSWAQLDPRSTHSWASTFNDGRGGFGFVSNHSEWHSWSGWLGTGFLGVNSHEGGGEREHSLVSTVNLVLKLFTSNGSSTLESKSTRVLTDLKSNDFTGIWSNTNGIVSLLLIISDGSGQGNLDVSEWNSRGGDNNWDGRSTKRAGNFVWDINGSGVTINSDLLGWELGVMGSTIDNRPSNVVGRHLSSRTGTHISTSLRSTHLSRKGSWVGLEGSTLNGSRNGSLEVTRSWLNTDGLFGVSTSRDGSDSTRELHEI